MRLRLYIVMLVVVSMAFAYQALAAKVNGVSYGPHNLASWSNAPHFKSGGATPTSEVCIFCHTPHLAAGQPLWNRDISSRSNSSGSSIFINNSVNLGGVGFHAYSSTTTHYSLPTALGYDTLLCMSCHDGVSALNVLHNNPNLIGNQTPTMAGGAGGDQIGDINYNIADIGNSNDTGMSAGLAAYQGVDGAYNFYTGIGYMELGYGTDGIGNPVPTADHPISINYQAVATINTKLRPIATVKSNAPDLKFSGSTKTQLECTTCHDPHVNYDATKGGDARFKPFLSYSNASSALCFQCHIK